MELFLKSVLEITIFSSIMICILLVIKAIWQTKINFKIISFLWIMILVRLLLPITFEPPLHLDSLFPIKEAYEVAGKTPINHINSELKQNTIINEINSEFKQNTIINDELSNNVSSSQSDEIYNGTHSIIIETKSDSFKLLNIWTCVFSIWLMGMSFVILLNVYKLVKFQLAINRCKDVKVSSLVGMVIKCKQRIGLKKYIEVIISKYVSVPVTFGLFRPKILIPHNLINEISQEKLELIILHELYHIKRYDILKNYLWLIAKSIHWFNPLVWIAYIEYIDDVEISVDNTIISSCQQNLAYEYSQSIIDVMRLSNNSCKIPVAMSFCSDKIKLKKRFENMVKPSKKFKSANIISILVTIIMLLGCFTTACQNAHQEEVVKDKQIIEDKVIKNQNNSNENKNSEIEQESESIGKDPDTFTKTYEKDNVKIIVDAKVDHGSGEKIPSVVLEPKEPTQQLIDTFLDNFIGDAPLYKRKYKGESKSAIQEEILDHQNARLYIESKLDEVNDSDDPYIGNGTQQETIKIIDKHISELEDKLKSAPEKHEYIEVPRQLEINEYARYDFYAPVENCEKEDGMVQIDIHKRNGGANLDFNNINHVRGCYTRRKEMKEVAETITMPLEEAIDMANEEMEELGVGEMYLRDVHNDVTMKNGELTPCYNLSFSKSINSWPLLDLSPYQPIDRGAFEGPQYYMEHLSISVDESGVIAFDWSNITQQTEVLDDDVSIISFDKVIEIFEDNIFQKVYRKQKDLGLEVVIDKITLSLYPVKMKGSDSFVTVPVWDFRGYCYAKNDEDSEDTLIEANRWFDSYLTINAIDGSIVDRLLGY